MENPTQDIPNKLETARIIEQTPLQEKPMQNVLAKWFEIHDSIHPSYVSRQEWNERNKQGKGFLENNQDDTKTILLPTDLHLWEMVGVIEEIDKDTFINKPEIWQEKKREFQDLGKMFRNSAIYMAQRIDHIREGRSIAEKMVQEFFAYGNSLSIGYIDKKSSDIPIEKIALNPISPEDTEKVDKWLAGDNLYESRMLRVQNKIAKNKSEDADKIIENVRNSTLAQLFRIVGKPSQTSAHAVFLKKLEGKMQKSIEKPKEELYSSIFRRGLEKLISEIKVPPAIKSVLVKSKEGMITSIEPIWDSPENRKLVDSLGIDGLKKELQEVKKTGDIKMISEKEIEITERIQNILLAMPSKNDANNPTEMVLDTNANCVGATMLAGILMKKVGINHLVGTLPGHVSIIFVTSDKRVFWRDMSVRTLIITNNTDTRKSMFEMRPASNFEFKKIAENEREIEISQDDIDNIVRLANKPDDKGSFLLTGAPLEILIPWDKKPEIYVTISKPESGEMTNLLYNTSHNCMKTRQYDEAVILLKQAIDIDPLIPFLYSSLATALQNSDHYQEVINLYNQYSKTIPSVNYFDYLALAMSFRALGRPEEALAICEKGIKFDMRPEYYYNEIGLLLADKGDYEHALINYQKAVSLNPNYALSYLFKGDVLGKMKDDENAIRAYEQYISLAGTNRDHAQYVKNAKMAIDELRKAMR